MLRTIVDDTSPAGSSTPLEPRHQQLVIAWLAATARLHIAANLEAALLQNPLLSAVRANSQLSAAERTSYLRATVVVFAGFFEHRWLLDSGALDATIVAYMSALHWYACDAADDDDHHWSRRLLHQLHSAAAAGRYIRFVLVIKANRELPARLHDRLHRDLLRCVHRTDGYEQLVRSMLPVAAAAAAPPPPSPPLARICTAVGHICAHPHQQLVGFHAGVREQCGRLIERSRTPGALLRQPELQLLALCAHDTLVRMHRTAPDGFGQRPAIERLVFAGLAELSAPGDVLAGRVLQQHDQLLAGLQWVADAFLAAPAQPDRLRLPAAVLRPWLPLLLQLHSRLPAPVAQLPGRLVVYCLANVDGQPALGAELVRLLGERWLPDAGDRVLHERVTVVEQQSGRVSVQIGAADAVQPAFRAGDTLWSVLRDSGHNRLLYDVFVQLLGQLAEPEALRPVAGNGDQLLVHDADELAAVAHARCARTLAALQLLGDLIEHRPWQRLFGEQPADGLQAMRQLAEGRLRALRQWRETGDRERLDAERTDRTSGMLMAIVHEFVAGLEERRRLEVSAEFGRTLHEYRAVTANAEVRCQIDAVLGLLGGVGEEEEEEQRQPPNAGEADSASTRFERALRMCAEPEPYVRVFGLRELERMVRAAPAQRCAELVAQRFTVLSVAAEALRSDESYVFLNATRLLVALLGLMEADVVEAMLAEYERSAVGVDERLKVGEVIVKLVEELGELEGFLFGVHIRIQPVASRFGCGHQDRSPTSTRAGCSTAFCAAAGTATPICAPAACPVWPR